ncbi:DUF2794 domain-containing protein [Lichenihabitans sp. Uapishka_5]|uniref:DUF2794 domain-containing protein n=1 Tax=Lichenihabitans sp. Uapishka_5 TaxID=3037302 RepID=UPI0029E7F33D|nr:DUF2794 domain-containing protein [Lichenihabitans sp. Uapishka_5]MDX7951408.1 DUF2794 domain-containing protein [Lichenihabitans sp. Uapishka_5]
MAENGSDRNGGAEGEGRPAAVHPFPPSKTPRNAPVTFDRHELRDILNVYGRGVASGEWKDYALDFTPQRSVFSIYRRASEVPLYRVEKDPSLARRQGAYAVVNATGFVLKRGHELVQVLRVLEGKPKLSVV